MSRQTVRWGAAACALGIVLAVPQAVAAADGPDDDTSAGPANTAPPSAAGPESAGATRHGRGTGSRTASRTAAAASVGTEAPAAAQDTAAPAAQDTAAPAADSTAQTLSPRSAGAAEPATRSSARRSDGAAGRPAVRPIPSAAPVAAARTAAGSNTVDVTEAATTEPVPVAAAVTDPVVGVDIPTQVTAPQAAAATATVSTVGLPAGAATGSAADLLGGVLAPIQAFVEGIALLVRRTLFNEAPIVSPIQLTGLSTGPITGTVGAVDPEGDPISYSVTAAPAFGTVVVASDGSYTYTPGTEFAGTDTFTVAVADSGLHINLFNPLRPAATLANAVVTQGLTGPRVQFEFIYAGGALLWSQEARTALESAATILGSYFVVSSPVTVTYTVTGELSPLSGTLASASSDIISSRPGFYNTVVQEKIVSGVDVNGSTADGSISWNFGSPWAFGAAVDRGQYDFQSVAMHELLHTLGFLSNVTEPGSNNGTGWTSFDGFLVTADGTAVIGPDFSWNSRYDTNLTGGNGGLYFSGPTAVALYGGPVPLFTPSPWQGGSSMSHLDDMSFYGRAEQLMNAQVSTGKGIRTLSAVETAILTDLGYTMVPAQGASVVMLFGMVLLRRRRL